MWEQTKISNNSIKKHTPEVDHYAEGLEISKTDVQKSLLYYSSSQ